MEENSIGNGSNNDVQVVQTFTSRITRPQGSKIAKGNFVAQAKCHKSLWTYASSCDKDDGESNVA